LPMIGTFAKVLRESVLHKGIPVGGWSKRSEAELTRRRRLDRTTALYSVDLEGSEP